MQVHEMIRDYYPDYYDIERYPASKTVCIRKTTDEWGILGNFARTPIEIRGLSFDCTERLFHLLKFKPEAVEGIREMLNVPSGMQIKMHMKHIYKTHPEWLRNDWPGMVVDAMKYCLMLKYEQCDEFCDELKRTKGKYIVEDETARKRGKDADSWGTVLQGDEYVGPNLMGRLLMELRDEGGLEYDLPYDADDFVESLKLKDYLDKKERDKYFYYEYRVLIDDFNGDDYYDYISMSDSAVAESKKIFLEMYNRDKAQEEKADSFKDISRIIDFDDYMFQNKRLFELIMDYSYTDNALKYIDLDHCHYLYKFSFCHYDPKTKNVGPTESKDVELTDEEYIYLLNQQIHFPRFNFDHLVMFNPDLAKKIELQLNTDRFGDVSRNALPLIITFDSVREDAQIILESGLIDKANLEPRESNKYTSNLYATLR